MADLTAGGTGGAGLGTRPARYALITVWALGAVNGVIAGWMGSRTDLVVYLLALAACVALTGRGDDMLRPAAAALVAGAAVSSGVLLLAVHPLPIGFWPIDFASYLIALLIPRGNIRAATIGAALLLGAVPIVGLAQSAGADTIAKVMVVPVLALIAGVVWRVILRQIVMRERTHRSRAAIAARDIRIDREAAERYRAELDTIREQAGPLLRAIAAGEPLDPALRHRLMITEAAIRDRIRSPGLAHPTLTAAIADRRRAGVRVLLLGDSSGTDGSDGSDGTVGDELAATIGGLIAPVIDGSITIRAVPRGRGGAVSVLLSAPDRTERLLMAADGTVIDRR